MWNRAKEARLQELVAKADQLIDWDAKDVDKSIRDQDLPRLEALNREAWALATEKKNYEKAKGMSSYAAPGEYGLGDTNPGDNDNGFAFKGFGPGIENRIRPTSMYEMDKTQIKALQRA